jgi:hypothetical protein
VHDVFAQKLMSRGARMAGEDRMAEIVRKAWQTFFARVLIIAALFAGSLQSAQALPSFARQTGQQCVACHNGFPELTPYGRQFKLNGYIFSTGTDTGPPLAALIITSLTHTDKPQPHAIVPGTSRNDNAIVDAVNIYYAGKIFSNLGAFVQGLWSPLTHRFQLFTSDIRYADSTQLLGKDTTYGVTDPWNTAQSFWSYPYEMSHVTLPPVTSTALQGRYSLQVAGANAYVSWDQLIYVAAGIYEGLDAKTLNSIGVSTRGTSQIHGAASYWRVALAPGWGHSTWEVGTFGMDMAVDPHRTASAGTDHTLDVGFDTQYQYLADRNSWSFISSYIFERSTLDASRSLGFANNAHDNLDALNAKVTYNYDQTYGANIGYFQTTGSRDRDLYAPQSANDSPNSSGWIAELDYYAFNRGGPDFWPTFNLKLGLQYMLYTRFDGGTTNYNGLGRNANDNNMLFLYGWILF